MVKAFPAKLSEIGGKMENAKRKALHYYRALQRPVFSEDSGLYIQGLPKEEQPGVFVRRVGGRTLTDEEIRAHYKGIAKRLGGKCLADAGGKTAANGGLSIGCHQRGVPFGPEFL